MNRPSSTGAARWRPTPTGRLARLVTVGLAAALAVALGGAACGVGPQDQASTVPGSQVPYDLLDPTATAPRATSPGADPLVVPICLIAPSGTQIATVARSGAALSPTEVVGKLIEGPTVEEASAGWRTALPAEDLVADAEVDGGVASIDLRRSFEDLSSRNQLMAIAQLVCTLTAQPGIGRVAFTEEGAPIEVPRGDGSLTSGWVSRDAYASLLAP